MGNKTMREGFRKVTKNLEGYYMKLAIYWFCD